MIPWDCDVSLPAAERHLSEKYRRLSRHFDPQKLLWAEAVELVAFIQFLDLESVSYLMQWRFVMRDLVQPMLADPALREAAAPLVAENHAKANVNDIYRLFEIVRERRPRGMYAIPIVQKALMEEWHATGISAAAQARKYGLSRLAVQLCRSPRVSKPEKRRIFVGFA